MKDRIKEFLRNNKAVVIVGVVCFILGIGVAPKGISEDEYNKVKSNYETTKSELDNSKKTITELQGKVKEAEPFFKMDNAEKEAMKIESEKKEAELKAEQERLAKEKKQAELDARSVTLGNGTYLVGKDIPEGVYDLTAVKGGGNVQSSDFKVNLIMGVNGSSDFYQREQQNVALRDRATINLKSVTVKFVPDDEYVIKK